MLRFDQIVAVQELLAEDHSHRAVHRRTGVSRGAIARIAARFHDPVCDDAEAAIVAVRCPECGHRVKPPCRICLIRAWRATTAARVVPEAVTDPAAPPLGVALELRGEHLARYEALRRERLRASDAESTTATH